MVLPIYLKKHEVTIVDGLLNPTRILVRGLPGVNLLFWKSESAGCAGWETTLRSL
jgi:hypothetical protein